MHVLTPGIMHRLGEMVESGRNGVALTAALNDLTGKERYLALELEGRRYDIGLKYGLLTAQLALALDGKIAMRCWPIWWKCLPFKENDSPSRQYNHRPGPVRMQSIAGRFLPGCFVEQLLAEGRDLETFRRRSENLYERVRALFFLYAIHRFHLPLKSGVKMRGFIPFQGHVHLLQRRFEEAIKVFLDSQEKDGPSDAIGHFRDCWGNSTGWFQFRGCFRHRVSCFAKTLRDGSSNHRGKSNTSNRKHEANS